MQNDLTKGSILKNLIFFSLPYLLSCFLQTFYGMADLLIAGQFNGSSTITAISTGSQIMHMLTVIIVGLAMGSTVLISQAAGSGNLRHASEIIGSSISLFTVVSVAATGIMLLCTNGIIKIMAVPAESVSEAKIYLIICFLGIPFITAYNILSSIFRGIGDSKTPMYFVAIACLANILLDFLFIGTFHMGAAGAALGTVVSQTLSVFCAFVSIIRKDMGISLKREDFLPKGQILTKVIKVGLPVSIQDGLIQVSFMVITMIANGRGITIAAAVGIVEKIIGFLFLIPSAMLSSVSAIAAQNVGAGRPKRARQTLFYATAIAFCCGLIFAFICQFTSEPLIGCFSKDASVIRLGGEYLRSYSFDCAIAGIHFCFSGFFCAYGYSMVSFIHNILSIALIRIPGAFFASKYYPDTLFEMGLAAPLGSLLSAIICALFYLTFRKKGKL